MMLQGLVKSWKNQTFALGKKNSQRLRFWAAKFKTLGDKNQIAKSSGNEKSNVDSRRWGLWAAVEGRAISSQGDIPRAGQ